MSIPKVQLDIQRKLKVLAHVADSPNVSKKASIEQQVRTIQWDQ